MFSSQFIFMLDTLFALFISILPICKGTVITRQEKGRAHNDNVSETNWDCWVASSINYQGRRWSEETPQPYRISQAAMLCVEAERGRVTDRYTMRVKATPSALCIQKQWDLGRPRGPRQTLWNYSFPPTSSDCSSPTAGPLPLTAQTVCLVHILHPTCSGTNKRLNSTQKHLI